MLLEADNYYHIVDAIAHINNARKNEHIGDSPINICKDYNKALNKIWTHKASNQVDLNGSSDINKFCLLLKDEISISGKRRIFQTTEVVNLIELSPPILNQKKLLDGGYIPGVEISSELAKKASECHDNLKRKFNNSLETQDELDLAIKKLAELIYIVRSNEAHGEKTPRGPDLQKRYRDEMVCKATIPVQKLLIDYLFDFPCNRIASYGTLNPGQINEQVLSSLDGTWAKCESHGTILEDSVGLKKFIWSPSESLVQMMLFESACLPETWNEIDRFEGENYSRELIIVQCHGKLLITNCYVDADKLIL